MNRIKHGDFTIEYRQNEYGRHEAHITPFGDPRGSSMVRYSHSREGAIEDAKKTIDDTEKSRRDHTTYLKDGGGPASKAMRAYMSLKQRKLS